MTNNDSSHTFAPPSPKPLCLTSRDREVFTLLSGYGLLSTEQVYRLAFSSISRARKRLYQLWQHGFVRRLARPVAMGEGTAQALYTLSGKGQKLISHGEGRAKGYSRSKVLSPLFAEHKLGVNDFRICLELALRRDTAVTMKSWWPDRSVKLSIQVKPGHSPKTVPLIPDALFTLERNGKSYNFILEMDRGTADLKRLKLKFEAYLALFQEKHILEKFDVRNFRVLFVAHSEKRLDNISSLLKDLHKRYPRPDVVYVTTSLEYNLERPEALLGPIWNHVKPIGDTVVDGLLPITAPDSVRNTTAAPSRILYRLTESLGPADEAY